MKTCVLVFALLVSLLPTVAAAQTPIVIGPASVIEWGMNSAGVTPVIAQGWTYALVVDAVAPKPLTAVTCMQGPAGTVLCNVPAVGNAPIGSHTLIVTATDGVIAPLASTPFPYVTLLVPVPSGLKIR